MKAQTNLEVCLIIDMVHTSDVSFGQYLKVTRHRQTKVRIGRVATLAKLVHNVEVTFAGGGRNDTRLFKKVVSRRATYDNALLVEVNLHIFTKTG